jgi:DNA-directed RNA polymerase subunit RPC12/RpoP
VSVCLEVCWSNVGLVAVMGQSRYRCLFCGAELDEQCDGNFATLRSNVCEQCWQITLERAGDGKFSPNLTDRKTELYEMVLPEKAEHSPARITEGY